MQTTFDRRLAVSFLTWILLGLIAGFVASKIVDKEGKGLFLDVLLGIVGSVVGGWVFSIVNSEGVTGLNLHSLVVAIIGAVAILLAYHGFRRAA